MTDREREFEDMVFCMSLDHNGPESEIGNAIEELAELIAVLGRYMAKSKIGSQFVVEELVTEMADVSIVLNQIERIFHIKDRVRVRRRDKLERYFMNLKMEMRKKRAGSYRS